MPGPSQPQQTVITIPSASSVTPQQNTLLAFGESPAPKQSRPATNVFFLGPQPTVWSDLPSTSQQSPVYPAINMFTTPLQQTVFPEYQFSFAPQQQTVSPTATIASTLPQEISFSPPDTTFASSQEIDFSDISFFVAEEPDVNQNESDPTENLPGQIFYNALQGTLDFRVFDSTGKTSIFRAMSMFLLKIYFRKVKYLK